MVTQCRKKIFSTNVAETTGYSYGIKMNFAFIWHDFIYVKILNENIS